ncbi:hypothetical protein F4212_12000 [Candidatus Poribacteria bacterium]|nr:hypothetical protein [Candidatus Poribacteria bacterium]
MQGKKTKAVFFAGVSGCFYPFTIYPFDANLPDTLSDIGTVYIFTSAAIHGQYKPLYIGETDSLTTPILNYEKWLCVVRKRGDCVGIYIEDDAVARLQIKHDLTEQHNPPCND